MDVQDYTVCNIIEHLGYREAILSTPEHAGFA